MGKILLSLIGLIVLAGCQTRYRQVSDLNSDIILIGASSFPREMVGVWYNKEYGWKLKFERDGHLSEIIHTIGRQEVVAGQATTFPLIEGGTGVIVPGPWQVQYNGKTRELAVEVNLDSFKYNINNNEVRGSSKDLFVGVLSSKEGNIWRTDWVSLPEYIATTADVSYVDYQVPIGLGQEDKGVIVFEKVETEVKKKKKATN